MTPDEYLDKLDAIGWFDHLPPGERERIRPQLEKNLQDDPFWAYYALASMCFDTEFVQDEGPESVLSYYWLLEELAASSSGIFKPMNIQDRLDRYNETAYVAFEHHGRSFSVTVPFETDWFEWDVLELVNRAIGESGSKLRFIPLPQGDQIVCLVIQVPDVYGAAVRVGLIPTPEQVNEVLDEL